MGKYFQTRNFWLSPSCSIVILFGFCWFFFLPSSTNNHLQRGWNLGMCKNTHIQTISSSKRVWFLQKVPVIHSHLAQVCLRKEKYFSPSIWERNVNIFQSLTYWVIATITFFSFIKDTNQRLVSARTIFPLNVLKGWILLTEKISDGFITGSSSLPVQRLYL